MDAEHLGGATLVAIAMAQHLDEQRHFDFSHHHRVQVAHAAAIQIACLGDRARVETEVAMALAVS